MKVTWFDLILTRSHLESILYITKYIFVFVCKNIVKQHGSGKNKGVKNSTVILNSVSNLHFTDNILNWLSDLYWMNNKNKFISNYPGMKMYLVESYHNKNMFKYTEENITRINSKV